MINRFMRLLVFFDLPVSTRKKRKEYTEFRRFLIKSGFYMLQYSVYSRVTRNYDDAGKYKRQIERNLPPEGNVRVMIVTEKQYEGMELLLGEKMKDERYLDTEETVVI